MITFKLRYKSMSTGFHLSAAVDGREYTSHTTRDYVTTIIANHLGHDANFCGSSRRVGIRTLPILAAR